MASEKLIAFILKARQNKRSDEQIMQQLLSVGWKQDSITDAISEIKSQKLDAPSQQAPKPAPAPAQAAPPWVKPAAASPPSKPAQQPVSPPSQPSSASAPPWAAQASQSGQAAPVQQAQSFSPPLSQAQPAQAPPTIQTPQPSPQSPIPPASQIRLPPQKKPLFATLFGKKPSSPPAQAMASATISPQQPQPPAGHASAPAIISPPNVPAQPTFGTPASSQPSGSSAPGQSTLTAFSAGTSPPVQPGAQPAPPGQQPQSAAPATAAQGSIKKFLPIIAVIALLAIAAGAYYFLVVVPASGAPLAPSQPLPQNETHPAPSSGNTTPQVQAPLQNASPPAPPGANPPPPGNSSPPAAQPANSSVQPVPAPIVPPALPRPPPSAAPNATAISGAANPGASGTAAPNATSNASNATAGPSMLPANLTFDYYRKFTTYSPERLVWFCTDRGMEFFRMHWREYFGADCSMEKPKEGYVSMDYYLATGCSVLPCCINGPHNEYSRVYDYFECGVNSTG